MMKLTVGQLREALQAPKPVLRVEPLKIRSEWSTTFHYIRKLLKPFNHCSTGGRMMS